VADELSEDEEGDPRAELVRRLLEYQKYREAAEYLGGLNRLGRDVFERPPEPVPFARSDSPLREMSVFALVETFTGILRKRKKKNRHHVILDNISIRQRIEELLDLLAKREQLEFESLLEDVTTRIELIVTFLAMLEMAKMKLMRVFQAEDGSLYLMPRFSDPNKVLEQLNGLYENQYA
jgi:segregation and condensation protein A